MENKILIGTSGYYYDHWKKRFYPEDLAKNLWLLYYSKFFPTVELNITFYRLPSEKAFGNWYRNTPSDFVFSLKGSRLITHRHRLVHPEEPLREFMKRAQILEEKLGVVLWQLPPAFQLNFERLEYFLEILQEYPTQNVFEFRHQSWFTPEVYALLEKYKTSLVFADSPSFPPTKKQVGEVVYIRLHGRTLYSSLYTQKELMHWAEKIARWQKKRNVFVYLNNDALANAVKNAGELQDLLIKRASF